MAVKNYTLHSRNFIFSITATTTTNVEYGVIVGKVHTINTKC